MFHTEPFYEFRTDGDGDIRLLRVEPVDLDTVTVRQDVPGGFLRVEPVDLDTPVAVVTEEKDDRKYELVPEGDLFRLRALRDTPHVRAGQTGGLVSSVYNLSQKGSCWVGPRAKVLGDARVHDNGLVNGYSTLSGNIKVRGSAIVDDSNLEAKDSGFAEITESVYLDSVNLTVGGSAGLQLLGNSKFSHTIFDVQGDKQLKFAGCCVEHGLIRHRYDLVSIDTRFGWLSAFTATSGQLVYSVGCQTAGSEDRLRHVGEQFNISDAEKQMLEGFLAVVRAARAALPPADAVQETDDNDDDD